MLSLNVEIPTFNLIFTILVHKKRRLVAFPIFIFPTLLYSYFVLVLFARYALFSPAALVFLVFFVHSVEKVVDFLSIYNAQEEADDC